MKQLKLSAFGKKLTIKENREFIELITGANDDRLDSLLMDMSTMSTDSIYNALLTANEVRGDVFIKLLSITLKFYGEKHPFGATETANLFTNLLSLSGVAHSADSKVYFRDILVNLITGCANKKNINLLLALGLNCSNTLKDIDGGFHVDAALADKMVGIEKGINLRDVFINTHLPKCLEKCISMLGDESFTKDLYFDLVFHDRLSKLYLTAFQNVLGNEGIAKIHQEIIENPGSARASIMVMRNIGDNFIITEEVKCQFLDILSENENPVIIRKILSEGYDLSGLSVIINWIVDNAKQIISNSDANFCYDFLKVTCDIGRHDEMIHAIIDDYRDSKQISLSDAASELLTLPRGPVSLKTREEHLRDFLIMYIQTIGLLKSPPAIRGISQDAFAALWPFTSENKNDESKIIALYPSSRKTLISNSFGL